ncbi:hypothetical protein BC829DRAFT_422050 [Chytridium lagenaria]|nr:hypothetical protein BC829DRAFT_422050 [Chytridium lagenaria]
MSDEGFTSRSLVEYLIEGKSLLFGHDGESVGGYQTEWRLVAVTDGMREIVSFLSSVDPGHLAGRLVHFIIPYENHADHVISAPASWRPEVVGNDVFVTFLERKQGGKIRGFRIRQVSVLILQFGDGCWREIPCAIFSNNPVYRSFYGRSGFHRLNIEVDSYGVVGNDERRLLPFRLRENCWMMTKTLGVWRGWQDSHEDLIWIQGLPYDGKNRQISFPSLSNHSTFLYRSFAGVGGVHHGDRIIFKDNWDVPWEILEINICEHDESQKVWLTRTTARLEHGHKAGAMFDILSSCSEVWSVGERSNAGLGLVENSYVLSFQRDGVLGKPPVVLAKLKDH